MTTEGAERRVDLTKMGEGRYKATNVRGGVLPVGSGDDPDFTPVELLLAALAGCGAIDIDLITGKRAGATSFDVVAEGTKIRDDQGNRLVDLRVTFDVRFPEGEAGDRAREVMPSAMEKTRDRLCTVGRTIKVGADITYGEA
ncbi:oxidoreductase [Nocardioides sp. Root1257]|uniref:OsmC family protein n=1 Tax=unclassified Nocardioides TaxID=2615069 RepID=UPI0007014C78|nr:MULTISPECIES: OsmC family protein [unclassified Nocardioides]KQW52958.1 oxidoreductase [Nocardioides sp. Root1257]KRC55646.1 oxidoreductase [Nocardioides sp. Root224]